jgi:hypothetical protein
MGMKLLERGFFTEDDVRKAQNQKKFVISKNDTSNMIELSYLWNPQQSSPNKPLLASLAFKKRGPGDYDYWSPFKTKKMTIASHDCLIVFNLGEMKLEDLLAKQGEEVQLVRPGLCFVRPKVPEPEKNSDRYFRDYGYQKKFDERYEEAKQKQAEYFGTVLTLLHRSGFYLYKGSLYYFDGSDIHSEDEQKLLVKEDYFKRDKRFANLRKEMALFEKLSSGNVESREPIPQEVRFAVWRRDEGKCVSCGSNQKLEYDHIIPVSKGGSSTERNIQLLCEKCNREKSAKI